MQDINVNDIRKFGSLVSQAAEIAIVTHTHPDGDAMGSSTAMLDFLRNKGKNARIILNDTQPDTLGFITRDLPSGMILSYDTNPDGATEAISRADLVICLDFNAFSRTDNLESPLSESPAPKILIDHHLNPDKDRFTLIFSETEISSTCELLYYILKEAVREENSSLSLKAATSLMTGMTTDTNNFANSVFPSTLAMASELLAAGVDREKILSELYNNYRENRIRLQGYLLDKKLKITDDGVAYMILTSAEAAGFDLREGETEGFVNIPLAIGRVRMSILAKEDKGRYRISIRSKKGTSANICAKTYFNGGGHELAAGGRILYDGKEPEEQTIAAYIEASTAEFFKK